MARTVLSILISICFAAVASAQTLSLPLDGYYHPGRYMPVRFEAAGVAGADVRLAAAGAVTTLIPTAATGVAPFLILGPPPNPLPFSQPLHELGESDKLVGFTTDVPAIAMKMFPPGTVVPVKLNSDFPIAGDEAAWGTLDGLVVNAEIAGKFSAAKLLAFGVSVAVVASDASPPDRKLPWTWEDGYWVVMAPKPILALPGDRAYEPIAGWNPGRPADYRRQVTLAACILAVGLIGATMFRTRWSLFFAGGLAISFALAARGWQGEQSPVNRLSRTDEHAGIPAVWDDWAFERALVDCDDVRVFTSSDLPMLPLSGGPEDLTLVCESNGNPQNFSFSLRRDQAAAFVARSIHGTDLASSEPSPRNMTPAAGFDSSKR